MATRLKNLHLKKVDLVDEGANPGAYVTLFKRKETEVQKQALEKGPEEILKRFCDFLVSSGFDAGEIAKSAVSFQENIEAMEKQKVADEIATFIYSLSDSFRSILFDDDMDSAAKQEAMSKSLAEFVQAASSCIGKWASGKAAKIEKVNDDKKGTPADLAKDVTGDAGKGDEDMKIDKSKMTPEERKAFEELVRKYAVGEEPTVTDEVDKAKAQAKKVDPEGNQEEMEDEVDVDGDEDDGAAGAGKKASAKKSITGGIEQELKAELESLKKFRSEMELKQMETIAKKYEVIGKKPEELAKTLKKAKDAGGTAYDDMVSMLDEMVSMQEATGIFAEVGKSGHAPVSIAGSETVAKAREVAKKYVEADPGLTMEKALAKAWEDHPELMDAYEEEAGF